MHLGNTAKSNGIIEIFKLMEKLKYNGYNPILTIISASSNTIFKKIDFKKYKRNFKIKTFNFLEEKDLKNVLSNSTFGMALYFFHEKKRKSNVMNGKVYFYLKNNLPVITTNYCSFARDINNENLGFCSNNLDKIYNYIIEMNNKKFNKTKKNILYFLKKNRYELKISKIMKKINTF